MPKVHECLYTEGMKGWFQPQTKTVFSVTFGDVQVPFKALNLWDNHPAGRGGKLIDKAVK